jgi:hypothetical protein
MKLTSMCDVSSQRPGGEFQCPECFCGFVLSNWTTEYGEALSGEYDHECSNCGKVFTVEVDTSPKFKVW